MMRSPAGHHLLRLLGILCATAGVLAWLGLAWKAFSDIDALSAKSEEGGGLLVWGLSGTLLMIIGTVILHVAEASDEGEKQKEGTPS